MLNFNVFTNFVMYLSQIASSNISSSSGKFTVFFSFQRFFFKKAFASQFSVYFLDSLLLCNPSIAKLALNFSNISYVGPSLSLSSLNRKEFFFVKVMLKILALCSFLKYDHFIDFTAVDFLGRNFNSEKGRFQLSYLLTSLLPKTYTQKLHINFLCSEYDAVHTLTDLFPSANWAEREIWDFFGIRFYKNLDLRRLLSDYGFRGFPLRKDFPTVGFKQVKYDEMQDSVIYEDLFLMQEERESNFVNPWVRSKAGIEDKKQDLLLYPISCSLASDRLLQKKSV